MLPSKPPSARKVLFTVHFGEKGLSSASPHGLRSCLGGLPFVSSRTHGPARTLRHVHWTSLHRRHFYVLPPPCALGGTHVVGILSRGHRVKLRKCGMLRRSRASPGRGCGGRLVWPVRRCQVLGAREARRGELINNRTYP